MFKAKIIFPIALVCSIGAVYIAKDHISGLKNAGEPEVTESIPEETVLVAAADIEIGAEIAEDLVTEQLWPSKVVPQGSFSHFEQLRGRVTRKEILMGDPIIERKLAPSGSIKGLSSRIPIGKVAMTVGVNVVSGVSGFILPGCKVDVIVTTSTSYSKESAKTKIILQNVEVIAVDQETQRETDSPLSVQAVTLLVSPVEAEKLALASSEGKLQLILRNATDDQLHSTSGTSLGQLIDGPKKKKSTRVYRPTTKKKEVEPQKHTVEVYRSSEKSEVDFEDKKE